jgi:hypothetical protein
MRNKPPWEKLELKGGAGGTRNRRLDMGGSHGVHGGSGLLKSQTPPPQPENAGDKTAMPGMASGQNPFDS